MANISDLDRKRVKGQGFLSNNDGKHFSARVITQNGTLTAQQLRNVSEVADKFGNGTVAFTSRLTVEVPGIEYEDIENVKSYLAKQGLTTGGTGSRVRPIVSCKGTVCVFGLTDTQGLAKKIHQRFYEGYYHVNLPHKFKIGIGGCPNNCVKPDLNDFGMVAQHVPEYNRDICSGCKKCAVEKVCRVNAAQLIEGKLAIDKDKCINCGLCADKCPFGAVKGGKRGFKLFIGGKWGKMPRPGTPFSGIYTMEEALDIIEKAILLYREKGLTKERFGDMVDRMGIETFSAEILKGDILARKQDILDADLH